MSIRVAGRQGSAVPSIVEKVTRLEQSRGGQDVRVVLRKSRMGKEYMGQNTVHGTFRRRVATATVAASLVVAPGIGTAEIIWSGDYRSGNFTQWHKPGNSSVVTFHMIPDYGRPIQYGKQESTHVGNGDLLSLVAATDRTVNGVHYPQGPTRGDSEYAAKFTVKNSEHGSEPRDCDQGDRCQARRTELTVQSTLPQYDALSYRSERWMSISHYLPSDWDDGGNGSGVMLFQVKPKSDGGGIGPCIAIEATKGQWEVEHSWTDVKNYREQIPPQQAIKYTPAYPSSGGEARDLLADFPDVAESRAALKDLNKGGWTDWVFHVVFDARGSRDGGKGLFELWKRAGTGPWVKVLHIEPKEVTVDGKSYDRGICYNSPAGFGIKAGMYMAKSQVWNLNDDRYLYNANIKVGDAASSFAEMSPDGSSPNGDVMVVEQEAPPKPPTVLK